ncbi:MAG TPA: PKD domain-containing protein [Thermoanaerobaculia bacterium]
MIRASRLAFLLVLSGCLLSGDALRAATYLPMSDADLVAQASIIVRAELVDQSVRVDRIGTVDLPFTIVTLHVLEAFKGDPGGDTIRVRLPGGTTDSSSWSLPGTPAFASGGEFVLMLDTIADGSGERRLSEFGLAKFDLVSDESGRRFAVRPVFSSEADVQLSRLAGPLEAAATGDSTPRARDGESFLAALRRVSRGEPMPPVAYVAPVGGFIRLQTKFSNIGGFEPTTQGLFRWNWDAPSQPSPTATAMITGTQSNLGSDDVCNQDSSCYVQNAVTQWHGVASSNVQVAGPSGSGNLKYVLDAAQSQDGGMAWNSPFGCSGGTIGLGGPDPSPLGPAYRGDSPYYQISSATVSMRKSGCATAKYSGKVFKSAVLHESGHALGLGHPGTDPAHDEAVSLHNTTTQADWTVAVMHWSIPPANPSTPQTDDVQSIQYLYGTAAAGPAPVANFSVAPGSPSAGSAATFTDSSTNAPTGWYWDFGDGGSSTDQNPTHTFAAPGSYSVKLSAGNFGGTGVATKSVAVVQGGGPSGPCTPDDATLCLSSSRFKVTAMFQKPNDIARPAHAVPLTGNTGYFWFFDNTNVEVVTKVLPFCSDPFNSIWVFAAGLTNVKVDITYLDTQTSTTVIKSNPQGTAFAAVQDTAAFKTCP